MIQWGGGLEMDEIKLATESQKTLLKVKKRDSE